MAVVNFVLNNLLNMYGAMSPLGAEGALASIGVVQRVAMFAVLPLIGVSIAIQPLLGFNYGAHLFERVKKTLWYGIFGATGIGFGAVGARAPVPRADRRVLRHHERITARLHGVRPQGAAAHAALHRLPDRGLELLPGNRAAAQVHLLVADAPDTVPGAAAHRAADGAAQLVPAVRQPRRAVLRTPAADFLAIFTTVVFIVLEMGRLKKLESGELKAKF